MGRGLAVCLFGRGIFNRGLGERGGFRRSEGNVRKGGMSGEWGWVRGDGLRRARAERELG